MGCGFGACMGCSMRDKDTAIKRICKDGPVLEKEEMHMVKTRCNAQRHGSWITP